ncbi:hypothetical protein MMC20_008142 [Loxospora ochrophaea]|nr:hypothetical protein [Loxospora ochrophaea]
MAPNLDAVLGIIDGMLDLYRAYFQSGATNARVRYQLRNAIDRGKQSLGVNSPWTSPGDAQTFQKATELIWRYSQLSPSVASDRYLQLITAHYNGWMSLQGKRKTDLEIEMLNVTNVVADWHLITREPGPRSLIIETAKTIAAAFGGLETRMADTSLRVWKERELAK